MNDRHVLAIGSFIIAGAHYVRNEADFWYVGWIFVGCLFAWLSKYSSALKSAEYGEKP
jgi:hypothetical protein